MKDTVMPAQAVLDVGPVTPETAQPAAAERLAGAKKRLGFLPNMYGYMGRHPAILGGYLDSYDAFRWTGGFTPTEQEVVFLVVSRVNGCSYCMAAHSMIAHRKSGVPTEVLAALRAVGPLPDTKLQALASFVEAMVEKRGRVSREEVEIFLAAGYTPEHVQAIVLAIAAKTFSNYTNHLTNPELDPVFAPYKVD